MLRTVTFISVYVGDGSQRDTLDDMQVCFVFAMLLVKIKLHKFPL